MSTPLEHSAVPGLKPKEATTAGIIRPARRPPGWLAPGPAPLGRDDDPVHQPGPLEDLCFLSGDWRIFQRLDGHRWSLDDLLTAWYGIQAMKRMNRIPRRTLDLGCGIGSVLMLVAWAFPETPGLGIEAQEVSLRLAERSLRFNGAAERVAVRLGDLRDPGILPEGPCFDLVTGTPPYLPFRAGVISPGIQRGPCRFEFRGGIEAYCAAAARSLAPGGRFVVCEGTSQRARVASAAAGAGLVVAEEWEIVPRAGKPPLFSVYGLAHRLESGGQISRSSCVVRDASGQWTPGFLAVRDGMGLPSLPHRRSVDGAKSEDDAQETRVGHASGPASPDRILAAQK